MSRPTLQFNICDRYISQALIDSCSPSVPIPAWSTEATETEISRVERLKQFCLQDFVYPTRALYLEVDLPKTKPPTWLIPVLGLGMSLCLSANSSSSNPAIGSAIGLDHPDRPQPSEATQKARQLPSVPIGKNPALPDSAPAAKQTNGDRAVKKFILPVTGFPITSVFGKRIHPISGDKSFHKGIDIGTPSGTPIKASRGGQVVFAGWESGYGKTIVIRHAEGYETLYAHLDKLLVQTGDAVTQSDVIGLSGSTGYVTGPHLHFEILLHEVAHNPLNYF